MIELIDFDKYEATYKYRGLNVIVRQYATDVYHVDFPKINITKALAENLDYSYIVERYEITNFGETIADFFQGSAKEEIEEEIEIQIKKDLNKEVLIMMLFEDVLILE